MAVFTLFVLILCLCSCKATVTDATGSTHGDGCHIGDWNRMTTYYFPNGRQTTDYLSPKWTLPALKEITACVWLKTKDGTRLQSLISYASTAKDNEFHIALNGNKLTLWVLGTHLGSSNTPFSYGNNIWHHVCGTWQSATGKWAIYGDSKVLGSGSGMHTGGTIPPGGSLLIGQEQDSYKGGFDVTQCFAGSLSRIEIWDKFMTEKEIHENQCQPGSLFSWGFGADPVQHGGVIQSFDFTVCGNQQDRRDACH